MVFFFFVSMTDRRGEILERPTYRYAPTVVYMDAPALLETAGTHIMGHMTVHKRERGIYLWELIASRPVIFLSLPPKTDWLHGRIRAHPTRRISTKNAWNFFSFFFAGSHTHREKLSSSRMYVIYREKKNKTDSSAPSVSLIVNLARSWIFFFNFVQIQNDFPRKCIFKKNLVESIQERKKMAYRYVGERISLDRE